MILSYLSLHCKLIPVQYRDNKYGLFQYVYFVCSAEHTVSASDVVLQFVCLARTCLLCLLGTLPRLDAFATMKPNNTVSYEKNSRPVHATSERFLRLGLPSTLIRHENRAFWKRSSNRRNLKTPGFRFRVDKTILKTELFANDGVTIIMWFAWSSFPQTQIQNDRRVFRFEICPA